MPNSPVRASLRITSTPQLPAPQFRRPPCSQCAKWQLEQLLLQGLPLSSCPSASHFKSSLDGDAPIVGFESAGRHRMVHDDGLSWSSRVFFFLFAALLKQFLPGEMQGTLSTSTCFMAPSFFRTWHTLASNPFEMQRDCMTENACAQYCLPAVHSDDDSSEQGLCQSREGRPGTETVWSHAVLAVLFAFVELVLVPDNDGRRKLRSPFTTLELVLEASAIATEKSEKNFAGTLAIKPTTLARQYPLN